MKQASINTRLLYFLTAFLMVMMILCASLIRDNNDYNSRMRALVLQNDSIMAVNMELTRMLQVQQGAATVKSNTKQ